MESRVVAAERAEIPAEYVEHYNEHHPHRRLKLRPPHYGYLFTHYAIRALMQDAAVEAGLDPDRLSFFTQLYGWCDGAPPRCLFSPDEIGAVRSRAIAEIVSVPLPVRRLRSSPRKWLRGVTVWVEASGGVGGA